jgi:hypothetical protein
MGKRMERGYTIMPIKQNIRENGEIIKGMEKVYIINPIELNINCSFVFLLVRLINIMILLFQLCLLKK